MGGTDTKHFYTIVGICEEEISHLHLLGFIAPLGFLQGGTVEGSFTLTDEGRKELGDMVKKALNEKYPKPDTTGEPIISDEEDD